MQLGRDAVPTLPVFVIPLSTFSRLAFRPPHSIQHSQVTFDEFLKGVDEHTQRQTYDRRSRSAENQREQ